MKYEFNRELSVVFNKEFGTKIYGIEYYDGTDGIHDHLVIYDIGSGYMDVPVQDIDINLMNFVDESDVCHGKVLMHKYQTTIKYNVNKILCKNNTLRHLIKDSFLKMSIAKESHQKGMTSNE